jgi:hypothetical protein
MQPFRLIWVSVLMFSLGWGSCCLGQIPPTSACAAFAEDGTLATGTIRNGDIETRLATPGLPIKTIRLAVGRSSGCDEAFSSDGNWLVTVVAADKLIVQITDLKTQELHRQFSSDWHSFHGMPIEPGYQSYFLGGFSTDNSLVLWRYIPQAGRTASDASTVSLHLQRWSIEGELISDEDLGISNVGISGRDPITADGFQRVWIPGGCGIDCYRGISFNQGQFVSDSPLVLPKKIAAKPVNMPVEKRFLSILGDRTNQSAVLLDYSGKVDSRVSLPFIPNLLGPLVPDWFYARKLVASQDEQMAAVGRTRVAWVLVDTDRDWGSEVLLLKLRPLGVVATLKTGNGGIGSLAVDHRNGTTRLVGFWKNHWHELRWKDHGTDKWETVASW